MTLSCLSTVSYAIRQWLYIYVSGCQNQAPRRYYGKIVQNYYAGLNFFDITDNSRMKIIEVIIIVILIVLAGSASVVSGGRFDSWPKAPLDKALSENEDIAYFEGDSLAYVIGPPRGFKMVFKDAQEDGYAMAFIPATSDYDSAHVVITTDIFTYKGKKAKSAFRVFITADTAAISEHYGSPMKLHEVDSIYTSNGTELATWFIEDKSRFIPNVMIAYLLGGSELFVFDLSIRENYPRFEAEEKFIECLQGIKVLVKGELGAK